MATMILMMMAMRVIMTMVTMVMMFTAREMFAFVVLCNVVLRCAEFC